MAFSPLALGLSAVLFQLPRLLEFLLHLPPPQRQLRRRRRRQKSSPTSTSAAETGQLSTPTPNPQGPSLKNWDGFKSLAAAGFPALQPQPPSIHLFVRSFNLHHSLRIVLYLFGFCRTNFLDRPKEINHWKFEPNSSFSHFRWLLAPACPPKPKKICSRR